MPGLERLGESDGWGETLLWVLDRDGWTVIARPALGSGHLVIAHKDGLTVTCTGATLVDAARNVFAIAARSRRAAA